MDKNAMINEILNCMRANGLYISGDTFFALAFRTEDELRGICRELHINTKR